MATLSLNQLKSKQFRWSDFEGNVAVLGYGLEGQSTYQYLIKAGLGAAQIKIYDASDQPKFSIPAGAKFHGGPDYITKLNQDDQVDVIFRSPPINPDLIETEAIIWSATNEFLARLKTSNTIGVTGTKGKGTTCSLISLMLKNNGQKVHLLGNIGKPALEELNSVELNDWVVLEMSSFQLWDIKFSPRLAVILMVTEDHLDVHSDLDDYQLAKFNITKFQTSSQDALIFYNQNQVSQKFGQNSPAKLKLDFPNNKFAHLQGDDIKFNEQLICSITDVRLIGQHNLQNIMAAINVAKSLNLSNQIIKQSILSFEGLGHRTELVKTIGGVRFFNDSYSSNPSATYAAINSFDGQKVVLIIGGVDRGVSFDQLAKTLKLKSGTISTLVYGQNSSKIEASFKKAGYENYKLSQATNLDDIARQALSLRNDIEVVLFSPGSASFDMFNNFEHRGRLFRDTINRL